MIGSRPAVATSAMCGMSSMASLPRALPSAMPLESMPRGDAVRRRHAVADEQDDVLRLARPVSYTFQRHLAGVAAVGHARR